ncbi:MAG: choice-of-anchor B family protein [Vicinamibacterales bacterium]
MTYRIRSARMTPFLLSTAVMLASLAMAAHDDPTSKHKHKKHDQAGDNGQPGGQALSALGLTPCASGLAFNFPCRNVDLASFLPLSDIGGGSGNDIWGWTDPLTSKEYALMGRSTGTSFVDISDPERPVYLGNLPTQTVESSWRGIKVSDNYAFIVSEASAHGMQIFDLTQLRSVTVPTTFSTTSHYAGFGSAHTLAINENTRFAYAAGSNTCAGGLHMVNIQNPTAPVFAGCVSGDGYSHETQCVPYNGPDARYVARELCFSSNTDTLTITDVTDKGMPVQLSRTGYVDSGYAHQGWLTEDHRYFLMDDELDEQRIPSNTRTIIWDVSDVAAPFVSGVYVGPSTAIDHNLYIRGQLAYEANYRSGLRILDISNVAAASLSEAAYFDIYPADDALGYNGAWSNYPFFPSGIVIVSGIEQGLFVLRPTIPDGNVLPAVSLTSPAAGATYTAPASIGLAASASDGDGSIDRVEFYANGSLVGTDTTAPYQVTWSGVGAGSYSLTARAVDNVGGTTQSSPVSVTVNSPPSTMHVGNLDSSAQSVGRQIWKATVTTTVHDAGHNLVTGATVSGQWTGGYSGAGTCTTNGAGQCSLTTGNINVKKTSATFTVTTVTRTTYAFSSTDNHDVNGGSNGSTITVIKP